MTKNSLPAGAPRESYIEAAEREMIAFERREREFKRRTKRERAAELRLPIPPAGPTPQAPA